MGSNLRNILVIFTRLRVIDMTGPGNSSGDTFSLRLTSLASSHYGLLGLGSRLHSKAFLPKGYQNRYDRRDIS